jgi:hypothetical protein
MHDGGGYSGTTISPPRRFRRFFFDTGFSAGFLIYAPEYRQRFRREVAFDKHEALLTHRRERERLSADGA